MRDCQRAIGLSWARNLCIRAATLLALGVAGVSCQQAGSGAEAEGTDAAVAPDQTSDTLPQGDGASTAGLVLAQGVVQATVVLTSSSGATLTLSQGTKISYESGDDLVVPAESDAVEVLFQDEPGGPAVPAGATELARLNLVVKVNGNAVNARFDATAGPDAEGAVLALTVAANGEAAGKIGGLYAVKADTASIASTQIFEEPPPPKLLADPERKGGSAADARSMRFRVAESSKYAVGAAGGTPGGSAPEGAFYATYAVVNPGCVNLEAPNGEIVPVCGAKRIQKADILEVSTKQWLGECVFGDSDTASVEFPPGYQFWCQRTAFDQDESGTAIITVSSPQANLPMVHWQLVRVSDGQIMYYGYQSSDDGLHTPDGVMADPYNKKEWQYAGFKRLTFESKTKKYFDMRKTALNPLVQAGYNANLFRLETTSAGMSAIIDVYDTLDGRAKMEDTIKANHWQIREVKGNTGKYDDKGGYKGTAHAVMTFPNFPSVKVWEITANVTFEQDNEPASAAGTTFKIKSGTITQVMYTSLDPSGMCKGDPATFTDTYNLQPDDGHLVVAMDGDTIKYSAGASISSTTPLTAKSYQYCCPGAPCSDETMEVSQQQHEWLNTGPSQQTADAQGNFKGSWKGSNGTTVFEWDFQPDTGE